MIGIEVFFLTFEDNNKSCNDKLLLQLLFLWLWVLLSAVWLFIVSMIATHQISQPTTNEGYYLLGSPTENEAMKKFYRDSRASMVLSLAPCDSIAVWVFAVGLSVWLIVESACVEDVYLLITAGVSIPFSVIVTSTLVMIFWKRHRETILNSFTLPGAYRDSFI